VEAGVVTVPPSSHGTRAGEAIACGAVLSDSAAMTRAGGARLPYPGLPAPLRADVGAAPDSPVPTVTGRPGDSSPGTAAVLTCSDRARADPCGRRHAAQPGHPRPAPDRGQGRRGTAARPPGTAPAVVDRAGRRRRHLEGAAPRRGGRGAAAAVDTGAGTRIVPILPTCPGPAPRARCRTCRPCRTGSPVSRALGRHWPNSRRRTSTPEGAGT
jgi:hypothetical protein